MIENIGSQEVTIGPGPFGTLLNDKAAHSQGVLPEDLADPARVLDDGPYADQTQQVAVSYLQAGARLITTNTFGLRRVVSDRALFREGLGTHIQIARNALRASSLDGAPILVSVGPPSNALVDGGEVDCYAVDDLTDEDTGFGLYSAQFEALAEIDGKPRKGHEPGVVPMVETIGTRVKLHAAVKALAHHGLEGFVNLTLVDGKFLDGSDPAEAIREVEDVINGHRAKVRYGVNCCDHHSADAFFRNARGYDFAARANFIALNGANGDPRHFNGCSEHGEVLFDPDRPSQISRLIQNHPTIKVVLGCCGFSPEKMKSVADEVGRIHG